MRSARGNNRWESERPWTEWKIPLALVTIGAAGLLTHYELEGGPEAVAAGLTGLAVGSVVGVGMMLVGCYITAAVLKVSFGLLRSALLKLAGIFLFGNAVASFIPAPLGEAVGGIIAFGLLMWLFELEFFEAFALGLVMRVMNFAVIAVLDKFGG